jgi:hypothetical protein
MDQVRLQRKRQSFQAAWCQRHSVGAATRLANIVDHHAITRGAPAAIGNDEVYIQPE